MPNVVQSFCGQPNSPWCSTVEVCELEELVKISNRIYGLVVSSININDIEESGCLDCMLMVY